MPTVSRGSLFRRSRSPNWFIKFYLDGRPCRETTGTPDRVEASAFLARRIDEARRGLYRDVGERITFAEMKALLLRNYAFKQNRTDPTRYVNQLASAFGAMRGEEITEERIAEYSHRRLEVDHAAPATLHRELSVLRRMLRLASHRLPRLPVIDMPRVFPFKYHGRLEEVLRRQRRFVSDWERAEGRLCPAVFPWRGRPMQKLRRSWKNACRAAGMPGRLVHDFRRTAVRNLIRAGVQQAIAMKITGHKTSSIFRRYLIVDEELLAQATGAVADYLEEANQDTERPQD